MTTGQSRLESLVCALCGAEAKMADDGYYRHQRIDEARALKSKPADWDPFTVHVEGDFNGPHGPIPGKPAGPAGGEGGV